MITADYARKTVNKFYEDLDESMNEDLAVTLNTIAQFIDIQAKQGIGQLVIETKIPDETAIELINAGFTVDSTQTENERWITRVIWA